MPYTLKMFEQTKLMGSSTDSIPPLAYENNFGYGRTHYYQSLLLGDEYKGGGRGIRHLMKLENEVMYSKGDEEGDENEGEVTYFAFGWHLDDLHVTWAHLEQKRTTLRTNTKILEDLSLQTLETASEAIHDAVAAHQATASHDFTKASARADSKADLEDSSHDGVRAAPIISISSDSSEESVGSLALRVILFGAIPAIIPIIPEVPIVPADPIVAPKVGTVSVVLPTGVLDLVDYSSSSYSDPSEDSLPPVPDFPLVSPSGSSSHDTFAASYKFPLAPVVALPWIRQQPAIIFGPSEAIPFDQLYHTHLNRPGKFLTARKRVRPIPARRLACRRVSHHLSDRHSSPDLSSFSLPSDHSLSGHTPPDTTDVDTSTPPRFVDTDDAEAVADVGISDVVVAHIGDSVGMRVKIAASDVREDDEEFEAEASAADTREINVDPLAIGDSSESSRGGLLRLRPLRDGWRIESLRLEKLKVQAMLSIERDRIDSLRWHMALLQEEFRQVRRDCDDTRRRLRRLESYVKRHLGFRP
ncbi:hypothetical protein Tco_1354429 [Tanacetum coccineum]